ncbi:hypothetical protein LHV02_08445 [Limosilactobacillus fermentum]|uniref:hypothetical protein n=1 Tax=Limosilactobacillus fermentum TaxID=1613 RepID=UPI0005557F0D|nr:hypothetical protein [Limosilactobacillus fermentum]ARB00485.1 hypothetical protein B5C32_03530 [Limosilactobacillus fermentum]MBC9022821.1 hypothetical protein [Limosilactobacillus fermentum CECT 5716]MCB4716440.1 hypothetical protein [Limosilactobacillus fermentum]MCH5398140.1 hypothetical protein [Limosilactobacillus fermentum]MCT3452008.1 hypothetical protein [Limosilactobacillus fermentum]
MTNDELKIGQVSNRLLRLGDHLVTDANRLVLHEPKTRSEAIAEHDAIIEQAEKLVLYAKDWKHEVTGRF